MTFLYTFCIISYRLNFNSLFFLSSSYTKSIKVFLKV
nr:MAG TPA: hypothetical protein [Caudoviricetes sp.]